MFLEKDCCTSSISLYYLYSLRADASDGSCIFKGQVSGQGNICWGGFFSPKQEATDAASAPHHLHRDALS